VGQPDSDGQAGGDQQAIAVQRDLAPAQGERVQDRMQGNTSE
jgi:hypothetical protein